MDFPCATRDYLFEPLLVSPEASSRIQLSAMSVQLRFNNLQEQKPNNKANARHVLRSVRASKPPESPDLACEATQTDGRPCKVALASDAQDSWCHLHHAEWMDLNARWNKANADADKITVVNSEAAKQKAIKLRLSVNLRRQIRDRFYPRGGDMQDYINWLAKMQTDVRQLADSLLSMHFASHPFTYA